MDIHKSRLSILAVAIILSLSSPLIVWGQDITITDSSEYPSTGIDASRYDDKLIGNTVTININDNQKIKRFTSYGAKSDANDNNYDLHGNKTYIRNGTFSDASIYGSASDYRFVDHNLVQVDNGIFTGYYGNGITGGFSFKGTVYKNQVIINDGEFKNLNIKGGFSTQGSISKNSVVINNGTFSDVDLYGGSSNQIGIVSDNAIVINKINKSAKNDFAGIYGGISDQGLLARNSVTINTDLNAMEIIGGYGDADGLSAAYGNSVTVNNSSVQAWYVIGAKNDKGAAYDNSVNLSNGKISGMVYGAYTENGQAFKNNVNITDSRLDKDPTWQMGAVYGAYSDNGNIHDNQVNINSSEVNVDIYGGYTSNVNSTSTVKDNLVLINNSKAINGNIYGGYGSGNAASNDNVVEIINSSVTGDIYGGYSQSGTADGNTVVVEGNTNISSAALYGGNSVSSTDNRLIVDKWSGDVKNIANFNEIIFGHVNWQKDGTVINITNGTKTDLSAVNIDGHWISFGFEDPESQIGETMHLIQNNSGLIYNETYNDEGVRVDFEEGLTHNIYGNVVNNTDGKSVDFTIAGRKQNEQLKLMTYNRNIGMSLVKQGNDLVSDIMQDTEHTLGTKTFAALQGNFSSYDVGGDAELNGWSGIVGVGNTVALADDTFTYGAFFENGSGNYKAYNTFNDNYFRFDGSAVYNGGGLVVRLNKADGFYTQASLRAGSLKNELHNGLYDGNNNSYGYTADTPYYSAKLELGQLTALSERTDLDVYTGFAYTHFEDTDFSISGPSFTNDFYFGAVDSQVLKAGMRIINKTDGLKLYYGVAYEYEFDGRSNITTKGEYIDDDGGLQGGIVIGELGASYKNPQHSDWVFDVKLRGYGGSREGISTDIQVTYLF